MIYALILAIHLIICVSLVLAVLLQAGKGGGLAGAFGASGGAAQTLFGGRGAATFLSKATTVLGIAFMTTSLALALLAGARTAERSVLRGREEAPGTAPPVTSEPIQIPGSDALGLPPAGTGAPVAPGLQEGTPPAPAGTPAKEGAAPTTGSAPAEKPAPAGAPQKTPPEGGGGN